MAKNIKTFCFFCNYEIYNDKYRTVLYKNVTKKVCSFCTPGQHKACQSKYKGCEIDCRVCDKPVKFKKCSKCCICNHLIHAQCNDLTQKDLKLIETYDSLICKSCTKSIFPFGTDNDIDSNIKVNHIKSKDPTGKYSPLQCFTCTNIIEQRKKYIDKHIIYDGKKTTLCKPCSVTGLNLPIRDKNKLEFLNCSVCFSTIQVAQHT